jgi:hypothetical protein
MKKLLLFVLVTGLITSCASNMQITGTWKSPSQPTKNYNTIVVAALTKNTVSKSTIETNVAAAFDGYNVKTLKAIDLLPPDARSSDTSLEKLLKKARDEGADAVVSIILVKNEVHNQYVPGYYGWGPWWWYPYYSPGFYERERVYVNETNIYDIQSGKLVWSVQTKTYDPGTLETFAKRFGNMIAGKMRDEGFIKAKGSMSYR